MHFILNTQKISKIRFKNEQYFLKNIFLFKKHVLVLHHLPF